MDTSQEKRLPDYVHLHDNSDPRGPTIIDHSAHLDTSKLPKKAQDSAKSFEKGDASHVVYEDLGGASPKKVLIVPGEPDSIGMPLPSKRFMVKPYYEHLGDWGGVYYPLAGWGEMATQALFHAGDIGHMAQTVHTFMDPRDQKPLIAIQLANGMSRADELYDTSVTPKAADDLAKLGFMDYLTNHQDRHGGNLLWQPTNHEGTMKVGKILAIDNGRSFGYRDGQRHSNFADEYDHLFSHMRSPGIMQMYNRIGHIYDEDGGIMHPQRLAQTFRWWDKYKPAIVEAFHDQLKAIKNPHVKEWLLRNFSERVQTLDEMSRRMPDFANDRHVEALDPEYDVGGLQFVNHNKVHPHGLDYYNEGMRAPWFQYNWQQPSWLGKLAARNPAAQTGAPNEA